MAGIPIHLLQAFVTFGDSKNIGEAARTLGLSQPGLSKQLKQLEVLLPAEAFTIKGRKKVFTKFGAELHQRLAARLDGLSEIVSQAAARHSLPEDSIVRVVGRRGVLDRISRVKFSGRLIFSEQSNEGATEALLGLRAELAILHAFPDSHELIAKPLFREELRLCLPKKNFARKPDLSGSLLKRLIGLPCLAYKMDDPMIHAMYASHSLSSAGIRVFRATESYPSLAEMMKGGLGWGILPAYLAHGETAYWAIPLPSRVLAPRDFYLVYRTEMAGAPWFKELIKELKACF